MAELNAPASEQAGLGKLSSRFDLARHGRVALNTSLQEAETGRSLSLSHGTAGRLGSSGLSHAFCRTSSLSETHTEKGHNLSLTGYMAYVFLTEQTLLHGNVIS